MQRPRLCLSLWGVAVLSVLIPAMTALGNGLWLVASPDGELTRQEVAPADPATVVVDTSDATGLTATFLMANLPLQPRKTANGEFVSLAWEDAALAGEIGSPALPVVRRLLVAPLGASVEVEAHAGAPLSLTAEALGVGLLVEPRQAPIPKLPGALENAPFAFDEVVYATDAYLLPERATLTEAGIWRGQRLVLLEVRPVAYNPARQELLFWDSVTVHIDFAGASEPPVTVAPFPHLAARVLNPELLPDPVGRGTGNYLIVVAQAYASDIAGFAGAKAAQGFSVSTYTVPAGTPNTAIKAYIQSLWGGSSAPKYVLLVGDTDTIPHWTGGGAGTPATDLPYVCMDGSSDWYPDIAIGRFSVRSSAHVQAIVDKTLYYENGPLVDPGYLKRAVFMASEDNYTVSEGTHNWVISTYMIPNGYSYDRLYCHTYSATTQQVRNAFNNGRFFGIYSGHGAETYWADGPYFTQSDVNALTNVGMYSYVMSFACVTGTYTVNECFCETWSRAANKAGVTIYGSSVNSYWTEDDVLERRHFDSIFDLDDDVAPEVGPVWIDTQLRYLAQMGNGSTTRRYFEMYNLLGDPSLRFPGNCSDAGTITLDRGLYACQGTATITVGDCGLNLSDQTVDSVTITVASTSEPTGENLTLYETDPASAEFSGTLVLSTTNAPGVLWVAAGDTITATYVDADDGAGNYNVVVTDTAVVDCTPPI
ncbi:MAG TPA: C25 family cysteine peptidase, partial [Phycisphaerae bacterium]|nr:C25 family cysteine peptidase [Phycisphaerae bacterium]HNU46671.1 C25 family cysteine peptidase [Phycisphaerae bacterium]